MQITSSCITLLFLLAAAFCQAECPPLNPDEHASLKKIYDGDTLQLTDDRRVRLISINTPELAQKNKLAQPLAEQARKAVVEYFQTTDALTLSFGERKFDRYDRLLAHVTHPINGSLEIYLVQQGLAFPIAVPPDVDYSACLREIADRARKEKIGIWNDSYWQPIPATATDKLTEEFRRVCGRVTKIDHAGPLWIELEGDLVIRVNHDDWTYFEKSQFDLNDAKSWLGKNIELWGWLLDRRQQKNIIQRGFKPWVIQARTPYVMRWIDQCR